MGKRPPIIIALSPAWVGGVNRTGHKRQGNRTKRYENTERHSVEHMCERKRVCILSTLVFFESTPGCREHLINIVTPG